MQNIPSQTHTHIHLSAENSRKILFVVPYILGPVIFITSITYHLIKAVGRIVTFKLMHALLYNDYRSLKNIT